MQTIWKGAISFGLVNVPVKMFTATQDNDIPMRMLHKDYNLPIRYHRTCPKCKEDVSWDDIVKGYEYEPGHYVTFEKEELEKLASEASREIQILDFIDLEEIDPIYFQKTYYLAPEKTGKHAYSLLVEALKATNKIGVANVTIRSKSSLAAIRVVDDNVLSMVTMFYEEEIRPVEEIPNLPKEAKINERELEMAKMLIGQLTSSFNPGQYKDEFRERMMDAIEDKLEGKEVKVAPEEKPANVIDLMEALKASLEQPKAGTKNSGKTNEAPQKKEVSSSGRTSARGKSSSSSAKKTAEPKENKENKAPAASRRKSAAAAKRKASSATAKADAAGAPKTKRSRKTGS